MVAGWVAESIGDGADDEAEGDRARVGCAETLLGVRAGSTHPGQQIGGGRGGLLGDPGGLLPGLGRRLLHQYGGGERLVEWNENVDHGLVAHLGRRRR